MIIMWKIILCTVVGMVVAQQATFDNYKVFRVTTPLQKQAKLLYKLTEASDGFSFWTEPSVKRPAELMVAPHKLSDFYEIMSQIQAMYEVFIENVQALINQGKTPASYKKSMEFDFENYYPLDPIYKYLEKLATQYPDKVKVIIGGKTYQGRSIKGVKVSFKSGNPGIFLEGGIHAREWIAPATVMYILHQLLTSNNSDVRDLAESHDWYIFPSVNPDGYEYTHTTNRMWRKTRRPYSLFCYGSDPNRNWGYKWNTGGSSNNPCSDTYAGNSSFSDIETKSMSEYITSVSNKIYAYIAFHSYSQLLLFPYGHTMAHLDNYDELSFISKKATQALAKRYGTKYKSGNVAETIYVATGGSMDWVKATFKTPIVYTYELRDTGRNGFLLPPNQIIPTGEETLDSLIAMFKETKARGYPAKFYKY